jgi:hypothetical protein
VDKKCLVFVGISGPMAKVQVFMWYDPLQQFHWGSNTAPEPCYHVGTVPNTTVDYCAVGDESPMQARCRLRARDTDR